ncbi:MAG: class I SAM-dependent methyltransferase [Alphaproteobacteria bacterium]|nr:class I SAM-dependent methyltransferase [Alphaproteobacteria bacterium]
MSSFSIGLGQDIKDYLLRMGSREPASLQALREETRSLPEGRMQISPEQGAFMRLLVELLDVRRYLEIGVFTGYSTLGVALAMPPDGRILACDVNAEWTAIARRHWADAGVVDRIDLRLAPAIETLDGMIEAGEADCFDLAFIDADKENYPAYYERALRLVRPGGLIAIDNTLWGGRVADPAAGDEATLALKRLNRDLAEDRRVSLAMTPIGDGLTLARRRP